MNATLLDTSDPKTKEFLSKIGEVVVLSRHLESIVEFFMGDLINPEGESIVKQNVTNSIVKNMEFLEKLDLVRDLIVQRIGVESQKRFLPTYNLVKECIEGRNDVAHSQWFIQYGNIEEGIPPSTQKINVRRGYSRGHYFDFSKAIINVELSTLDDLVKKTNKAITDIVIYMTSQGK